MSRRLLAACGALAAVVCAAPMTAGAQARLEVPRSASPLVVRPAAPALAIHAWPPTVPVRRNPGTRTLWGAVLGAAAGIVTCTAISNAIEEEGGFHTCTAKGYLLFGLGGAAGGALVAKLTE